MISFFDFSTRLQVMLERVKTSQSQKVMGALGRAIGQAEKWLRGQSGALTDLNARQLEAQLKQLRQEQLNIMAEAINGYWQESEQLTLWQYGLERDFLQKAVKQGAKHVVKSAKSTVWKRVMSRPVQATGSVLEPFVDEWSAREVDALNAVVRKAWAQGKTAQQAIQMLRGTKGRRFKDGAQAISNRHAKTLIHTATQAISTATRMELYNDNSDIIQEYQFIATLDGKTSIICRSLDRKKFKLGKGPVPPMHPNCRSTTIPVLIAAFDFLDKGAVRSSEQGYVDADVSYYDWLKTQPDSVQDTALGKARAKMFREGGLSAEEFAASQLDKNFQPLTVQELKDGQFHKLFES